VGRKTNKYGGGEKEIANCLLGDSTAILSLRASKL
jgi:hypothetical protein